MRTRSLAAACLLAVTLPSVAAEDRLTLLDGALLAGRVAGIDKAGNVTLSGRAKAVPLNGLRALQTGRPVKAAGDRIGIRLVGDGLIRATSVLINDEKLHVVWGAKNAKLQLPVEAGRAILFAGKPDPLFAKVRGTPSEDVDQLLVTIRGKLRIVRGLIESMNDRSAAITIDNRQVTIPRKDLHGIVFAYVKRPLKEVGLARVHLTDGSVLPGRIVRVERPTGPLKLRLLDGGELSVGWPNVSRIEFKSKRLQYVSDLKPADVAEQAIVALQRRWRKDRCVTGKPLRLGGRTYEKGLGVHSRSRLTFAADGKYETFTATIGLDDASGRKGDCLFVVTADGRELLRKRMKGRDQPVVVKVNIRGMKRVSLVVEPGRNLDIADHANWCDACFLRPAK
ncbi:MAG: NPCBM/NEW2 domain-containing protein [Planctomycetaceae bacterium]